MIRVIKTLLIEYSSKLMKSELTFHLILFSNICYLINSKYFLKHLDDTYGIEGRAGVIGQKKSSSSPSSSLSSQVIVIPFSCFHVLWRLQTHLFVISKV